MKILEVESGFFGLTGICSVGVLMWAVAQCKEETWLYGIWVVLWLEPGQFRFLACLIPLFLFLFEREGFYSFPWVGALKTLVSTTVL